MREWEKEFPEFSTALEVAEGIAEDRHVGIIEKAADGWIEVCHTETTMADGSTIVTVKKTRRFDPRMSALWLRTRRSEWRESVEVDVQSDAMSGINDKLGALVDRIAERALGRKDDAATS